MSDEDRITILECEIQPNLFFAVGDIMRADGKFCRVLAVDDKSLTVEPLKGWVYCRFEGFSAKEIGDPGDSTKTVDSSKSMIQNDVAPTGE